METINQIRQGDVLLIRCTEPLTRDLVTGSDGLPLAGLRIAGERTGHAHELPGEVYETRAGRRVIAVRKPTILTHQEHKHLLVPEGWWEVRIQREWIPSRGPVGRFD
jgi:hypothetical protein